MKISAFSTSAMAGVLGCLALTACDPKVQAKPESIEALSDALGIDLTASICTGARANASGMSQNLKPAVMTQASIGGQNQSNRPGSAEAGGVPVNMAAMDHSHIPVAVPPGAPQPRLSATLTRDVMSGYNLSLRVETYEMTAPPIGVPMERLMVPTINADTGFVQGHAHLYVNGEKIQRVYGNSIHIPASYFKDGMNQLNITINSHAHMFWTYEGKQIISSIFVNTTAPTLVMHQFDSFPVTGKSEPAP